MIFLLTVIIFSHGVFIFLTELTECTEFYRCAIFFAHKFYKFGLMWVANGGVATECEGIDFGSIAYPIAFAAFDIGMDIGVDGHKCD